MRRRGGDTTTDPFQQEAIGEVFPPSSASSDAPESYTFANVPFPPQSDGGRRKLLLAVGPDGGWDEPYELDLLRSMNFKQVHLGGEVGILKTEVALAALLARAHERLESE